MSSQRPVIGMLIIVLLTLSGCYRPAEGDFQPVDSQNSAPIQPAVESPTPTVIIIVPNASETPSDAQMAEETTEPSLPFDPVESPTLIIIEPQITPTDIISEQTFVTPSPTQQSFVPLATATSIGIITPQAPSAVEFPTFTLEPSPTPADALTGTPAADGVVVSDICTYTVRSGDNLFRIALNNNVDLDALRAANGIVGDIIQPGQVLTLPGCQEAPTADTGDTTTPSTSGRTHTVQAGETLGSIARLYGVSVADLTTANNLANPNILSIGQVLIIPDTP